MHDTHTKERQEWLKSLPRETSMQVKVAAAIERMGTRYLFHPANRVQRVIPGPVTLQRVSA